MTTPTPNLQDIKNQVAKDYGYKNYHDAWVKSHGGVSDNFMNQVAKRYATECVKASLEKAAENAKSGDIREKTGLSGIWLEADIDKSSITDPKNIVLL